MKIKTNLMDTILMWLRYIPARGRCKDPMSGDRCRCPKGHDGSHVTWRVGLFVSK